MAKTKDINDTEGVSVLLQKLDAETATTVEAIRAIVLGADKQVGEQVKWNSPSFFYTGDMQPFDPKEYKRDIVVMNLRSKDYVLLIFPTGARIPDNTGLLEGDYTDGRRMVKIKDAADANKKKKALQTVIRAWLKQVDK